jgi:hypothetical protein
VNIPSSHSAVLLLVRALNVALSLDQTLVR